jgi:hypothetical protein
MWVDKNDWNGQMHIIIQIHEFFVLHTEIII